MIDRDTWGSPRAGHDLSLDGVEMRDVESSPVSNLQMLKSATEKSSFISMERQCPDVCSEPGALIRGRGRAPPRPPAAPGAAPRCSVPAPVGPLAGSWDLCPWHPPVLWGPPPGPHSCPTSGLLEWEMDGTHSLEVNLKGSRGWSGEPCLAPPQTWEGWVGHPIPAWRP